MIKPKIVVFDLGKVLVDFDYRIAAKKFLKHCSLSLIEAVYIISQSDILDRYEQGDIDSVQFYNEICAKTDYNRPYSEFVEIFGNVFSPIQPMIELKEKLKNRGLKTAVFSNTNPIAIDVISRDFPFYKTFDYYILSYEVRSRKPAHEIYKKLEEIVGCHGQDILYFDDRPENVETGKLYGWQAFVHETPEKTIEIVNKMGLIN